MNFKSIIFSSLTLFSSYLGIVGLTLLFGGLFVYQYPLARHFFERESPEISISEKPEGLGYASKTISFKVEDDRSGIEIIRVSAEQARVNKVIWKADFGLDVFSKEVSFDISAKELGLTPGTVRVVVEAFDRSLVSNGSREVLFIPVSYEKPSLEVLTPQHNMNEFGTELVFYKVGAQSVQRTGVVVGDTFFQGFPASLLEEDFEGINNLYFAFFSVSREQNKFNITPKVYAQNGVGNFSEATFYYRVRKKPKKQWQVRNPLIKEREIYQKNLYGVLENTEPSNRRRWDRRLSKMRGGLGSPTVGDVLVYDRLSGKIDPDSRSSTVTELVMKRDSRDALILPDGGRLVFLDANHALGGVIAIDHGFGLVSVYSKITLNKDLPIVGSDIEAGTIIGYPISIGGNSNNVPDESEMKSSESLRSFEGFHYALLNQGIPINPGEWWDNIWMNDHILAKIVEMKGRFNVVSKAVVLEGEKSKVPLYTAHD